MLKRNATLFYFQTWNRVLIQDLDVLQKKAQVLYIDYGNEERIPVNRIHKLSRNIDLFPPCVSPLLLCKFKRVSQRSCFNVFTDRVFARSHGCHG